MFELWKTGWHLPLKRAPLHICSEATRSSSSRQSFNMSQSLSEKSKSLRENSWKVKWAIVASAKLVSSSWLSLSSSSSTVGENTLLELNLAMKSSIWLDTGLAFKAFASGHGKFSFSKILEKRSTLFISKYRVWVDRWTLPGMLLIWRTPSHECGWGCSRDLTPVHVSSTVIWLCPHSWFSDWGEPIISWRAYPWISTKAVGALDEWCWRRNKLSSGKSSFLVTGSLLLVKITCLMNLAFWFSEMAARYDISWELFPSTHTHTSTRFKEPLRAFA